MLFVNIKQTANINNTYCKQISVSNKLQVGIKQTANWHSCSSFTLDRFDSK